MTTKNRLFFTLCLIIQLYCHGQMLDENKTFRCHKGIFRKNVLGEYISEDYFCDGDVDCINEEDELLGCHRHQDEGNYACEENQFVCDGDKCKPITVRCNTIKDCNDGTDEQDCGDEINVKNCTSEDKFLCHDGLRCLDLQYTCDNKCNCFDCSDENENCKKKDDDLLGKCPETYLATAYGPRCLCDLRNKSGGLCDVIRNCPTFHHYRCQQRCKTFGHRGICSCYDGFYPHYSYECKSKNDFETLIIYSNEQEIMSLNETSRLITFTSNETANCTLLTVANNYIYCAKSSAHNKGIIFKIPLKSGKSKVVIETDTVITSIAVDYITNNIYFTSNGSLSVCSKNGEICKQLMCCSVQYIAVAPKVGWMFYMQTQPASCWNGSTLVRSNMDGTDEVVLGDDFYHGETSLVVDESQRAIHLVEKNSKEGEHITKFNKISFNNEFQKSTSETDNIQTFGIYDNKLFLKYDRQGTEDIFRIVPANLMYLEPIHVLDEEDFIKLHSNDNITSSLTSMYVYNSAVQYSNENPCKESPCSGLCLIKPSTFSLNYTLNYTCVCDKFTPRNRSQWCSSDPAQNDGGIAFWVVVLCILLSIILIFVSTSYCIFKKYYYYNSSPVAQFRRRNSESYEKIKFNHQEE